MAEVTGVSTDTLRYYEKAGLIQPVRRNAGNQRRYQAADVEWVRFLLRLRETGMPIARMREYAELRAQGDGTIRPRLELLIEHHARLCEQIETLAAHQRALRDKINTYHRMLAEQAAAEGDNGD